MRIWDISQMLHPAISRRSPGWPTKKGLSSSGASAIARGAIEIDLYGAQADFAVGCGYKVLNGGPGAPAFIFAAKRHQQATPVLSGWLGHNEGYEAKLDLEQLGFGTTVLVLIQLERQSGVMLGIVVVAQCPSMISWPLLSDGKTTP